MGLGFTVRFIIIFFALLTIVLPVFLFLFAVIALAARGVKKEEHWTLFNTIYFAFVTATTVGYGDYRPSTKKARIFSIIIALTGLITTGIMVSSAMLAVQKAFEFTAAQTSFIETLRIMQSYFR